MEFFDYDNLCKEMREYKANDDLTQKQRQQLRANNHELRQLERHLQSAVVNKQLNEQLRNVSQRKDRELRKKREENEKFAAECELVRKSVLAREEQVRQDKKMFLETLNCQLNNTQQKRRKDLENAFNDRRQMQNLAKQIQAEETVKRKEAELLRQRSKKEMEQTYSDIRLKQRLEKERNIDENKRNLSYQIECDKIKCEKEIERKRILEGNEDLSKLLCQQLTFINLEKENRERLLLSLSIEERRAKEEQDHKEVLVKLVNDQQKLRYETESYCNEVKTQKEIRFKEEEENFRIQNLRYLEERDKLWQLSEEKRRRKLRDHNKELREIIEQRRYEKANKIAEQILEFEKITSYNEKSDQLAEQERIFMLNNVPRDLLRYLPPGVLKSSDKELLQL